MSYFVKPLRLVSLTLYTPTLSTLIAKAHPHQIHSYVLRHTVVRVRQLLLRHRSDHSARILGQADVPLVGGLMCGLDLQKAFDALPHTEVHSALLESGVPDNLAAVIVQLHVQSKCWVRHGGEVRGIQMGRGLRQGCPVAPVIYAAWSCRLCRKIDERLGEGWCVKHGTLFADDIFANWVLHSVADLKKAISELRLVITVLLALGMSVSFQKSVAVLKVCGRVVASACKSLLVWRDGVQHLRIRCEAVDVYVPCATTLAYLGAVLSYGNYELQTYKTRAAQATKRFQELRRVLRTNGALSQRHRLRLYKAVVWPILVYSLTSVGVTIEVLKGVCSLVSGQLRKVLRIYEEGVTNQVVLQRAALDPLQYFLKQAQLKSDAIRRDGSRDEALKVQELSRSTQIVQALQDLETTPHYTSLARVPRGEVVAVDCPVCGVTFTSQASLHMHMQHRHTDINRRACLPFRRDQHALHGLPICRFCQTRLYDWRSLEKHITQGTCSRIKSFVAENLTEEIMLQRIAEEERLQAPEPPPSAAAHEQVKDDVDRALQVTVRMLDTHGAHLLALAQRCALCRQLIPDSSKIKIHWQRTHQAEWQATSQLALAESRSLCSAFTSPCSFCSSKARNSRDHSGKCASLFQLLAVTELRRQGRNTVQPSRGPDLKQSHSSPAYQSFDLAATPIGRYFRTAPRGPGDTNSSASGAKTSLGSVSGAGANPAGLLASAPELPLPEHWLGGLVLVNSCNYCYLNSSVIAMLQALRGRHVRNRALQGLVSVCQSAVRRDCAIALPSQLIVRSLLRNWTFDRRQHDAAELTQVLLDGLGLGYSVWEARYVDVNSVRTAHQGGCPIILPMIPQAVTLQQLINAWSARGYVHALLPQDTAVVVQIERNVGAVKNVACVQLSAVLWLPVFTEGTDVEWKAYQVSSIVEHHGPAVHAGHYRALLKTPQGWLHADDGVKAVPTAWSHERETLIYLVWLIPAGPCSSSSDPSAPGDRSE